MAAEETVKPQKVVFQYQLKDFAGAVVFNLQAEAPLPHPYLVWRGRLFVTSRDESGVLLERSYINLGTGQTIEKH